MSLCLRAPLAVLGSLEGAQAPPRRPTGWQPSIPSQTGKVLGPLRSAAYLSRMSYEEPGLSPWKLPLCFCLLSSQLTVSLLPTPTPRPKDPLPCLAVLGRVP